MIARTLNEDRRHLTVPQRAALAVKLLPRLEAEAKERQREHASTAPGRASNTSSANGGVKARLPPRPRSWSGSAARAWRHRFR